MEGTGTNSANAPTATPTSETRLTRSLETQRTRFLDRIPLTAKNHLVATLAEFIGTFMFLLLAFGATNAVNTAPQQGQPEDLSANPARLLFISLAFGMSLAVNAWVFYRVSGSLFNPAVTIALVAVGAVGYVRGALVIISQLLGGIAAAAVTDAIQPGGLYVTTSLSENTSAAQGFFIELFLTAQLVITILMLAVEKHRSTFMAPLGIGLSLFIAQMMGVYYTGGSLNPARSFGPSVVTGVFHTYHWIYWLGPILGGLLAAGVYKSLKLLEYETANPGQDGDGTGSATHAVIETLQSKGVTGVHAHNIHDVDPDIAPGIKPVGHGTGIGAHNGESSSYAGGPSMEAGRTE
ncbi:aquaporin-like protein [Xylariaceae sp. FL1272]|nr:aquaporin-like protein [Xylariaceae sp. FL1272]